MPRMVRFLVCVVASAVPVTVVFAQTPVIPDRLSLSEALRIAEQHNPTLKAALERVGVADAEQQSAGRALNPVFNLTSEGYGSGTDQNAGFFDSQEWVARVQQEFETGGRRRLRQQAAGASRAASQSTADDHVRRLRADVQRAYAQLMLAQAEREAAAAGLADIDQVIALSRARYQQGEISGGELRRIEVERLRFSEDELGADLAIRNGRGVLLALLGATRLDQPLVTAESLMDKRSPDVPGVGATDRQPLLFDTAALLARAKAGRADLAAVHREQDRAGFERELQVAVRRPNVTLGAGYRRDFGSSGLVFEIGLPLPLRDRNAGGVARAQADVRVASSLVAEAELGVALEVQLAVNAVEISGARVGQIERDYLTRSREARDSVLAAYRAGSVDLLDFLDAQRLFRDVQRSYHRALFDLRVSQLQLAAAVAGSGAGPADGPADEPATEPVSGPGSGPVTLPGSGAGTGGASGTQHQREERP
jgi:outer membrane protein, heavy metal efflux system